MVLAEGDKLPMGATFKKIVDGKPSDVPAADIFAGKKVCENVLQNKLLLHATVHGVAQKRMCM
jgi:hypothetical protein